ncbi:Uncharacterized protein dnm_017450 [Desulfonema magnum]|uniref:Uncharacterized protein n=1 Tax=Desulfonema magnum TaxID=45655 RepID=A0A975BI10_9BACT|nr:Uncharacterized protein dnm_017450 [Desulfonema magnum]
MVIINMQNSWDFYPHHRKLPETAPQLISEIRMATPVPYFI